MKDRSRKDIVFVPLKGKTSNPSPATLIKLGLEAKWQHPARILYGLASLVAKRTG
jgi:hypothetical protein